MFKSRLGSRLDMKIGKVLIFLIVITVFGVVASAKTLALSDYCVPDDGNDDSVGFGHAVDELQNSGGGTLVVGAGTWDIEHGINIWSFGDYGNAVSIIIRGDGGSVINLRLNDQETAFEVGNKNRFEMRGLIFTGTPGGGIDAGRLASIRFTLLTVVSECEFYGIRTSDALFHIGNTDATFENDNFDGNATGSGSANIHAVNFGGLTVKHSQFFDYGTSKGIFYSKSGYNSGSWINAEAPNGESPTNSSSERVVRIEDSRFDEGAFVGVRLTNVSNALLSGLSFNLSSGDGSTGIRLDNVGLAEVKMSKFGWARTHRPAVTAVNRTTLNAMSLSFGDDVYFLESDTSSTINSSFCRQCGENHQPLVNKSAKIARSPARNAKK